MTAFKLITIAQYSEQWPATFLQLRSVYETRLSGLMEGIEHVGSTSVPGLKAKPIIDIDIIASDENKLKKITSVLEKLGYQHLGDLGIEGREAFKRISVSVPLDGSGREWPEHNLYVCLQGSLSLLNHIRFRDYLRSHPAQAHAYGELKEKLASKFSEDINGYVEGKTSFIVEILKQFGFDADSLALIRSQNTRV
ncbi:GrpB family protein [Chryseosolibacter indicus]|uniref:GrpB family protein n=1 Tax=Chryseosolibacter indicus TaxID=2782351 RepID=A0ABS5VSK5_9BACT|nr:GrpB family protein [Chryseosolibacter indicus]MBT1704387.1 GrpB family protein [Chryseosolibacter indicus]